jgi:hypothetical protein
MRYFVIRAFGSKKDNSGTVFNFDDVDRDLIAPALAQCGFDGGTTGTITDSGSIHEDMFGLIIEADVVVCDISVHNANVFYELGVRHALRRKRTVLIKCEASADKTPFDIGGFRYLGYSAANPAAAVSALVGAIRQGQHSERETDSPVFYSLPGLAEAQPDQVSEAPRAFVEAVQLASVAKDGPGLARLAVQASQLRYPWVGLKLVAQAQLKLKNLEEARINWERLRKVNAHALDAELALGNVYERLSRNADGPTKAELLERSNQALRAALAFPKVGADARGEALAQQARNLKTLWRLGWQGGVDVAARRGRALQRIAYECFNHYRSAFEINLNGYYCGLAALQMAFLLRDLMHEPGWDDLHDSADDAVGARTKIDRACTALEHVVGASIHRALAQTKGEEHMWAAISRADWLFLTEPEPAGGTASRRVNHAYRDAVPADNAFAHDSVVSQLTLFRDLGFRAGMAQAAIDRLSTPGP